MLGEESNQNSEDFEMGFGTPKFAFETQLG